MPVEAIHFMISIRIV